MPVISIQDATHCDINDIQAIYQHYIDHSNLTLETKVPTTQELEEKVTRYQNSHAFLIILFDQEIIGFAYAYPFSARKTYQHSANIAMYLLAEHDELTLKNLIYQELENRLQAKGILNLLACLPSHQKEQINFLVKQGFIIRGDFPQSGQKLDQVWDLVWLSKEI
ncbi:GNAT family N-acetyltransferase [Facklamia miroungae]|uniref:Phosphinothricin acetyltransferase n=1 Tax=Facklamia miroungae TaxID=120956 RepID=A0A1G7P9F2_9LACT|nr:GNAT family N-acetyltransferase [Facklamia miroungae]NKZ28629.1 N-acetyltransferase [Facklamia miroungae]SDF82893.1 phosphinothricin acetyltransferase [Facklamia miroungae]